MVADTQSDSIQFLNFAKKIIHSIFYSTLQGKTMIGLRPDENVQRPQIAQNKTYLIDPEDSGGDACSEGGGQVGQTLF